MSSLHTLEDVERQAVQESSGETLSVSDRKSLAETLFYGLDSGLNSRSRECLSDRTAQFCFLCLRGKKFGQYAVRIHCFRPTEGRRVKYRRITRKDGAVESEKVFYKELDPKENSCESDAAIYRRLNDTCFEYQGKWKSWIPFYGIVAVHEVEFRLLGEPNGPGRIPIHIYPIDVEEIRKKTEQTKELEPDYCDGRGGHTEHCEIMMSEHDVLCVNDRIRMAKERRKKLDVLYLLKDCARDPWKANGLRTLEGLAQETCIYNNKQVIGPGCQRFDELNDRLRGIEFVMGWQMDRITCEMPVKIAWIWFSLAIAWLCVIVWGGSAGDWATAMAFGQLLVASTSLIFFCVKD